MLFLNTRSLPVGGGLSIDVSVIDDTNAPRKLADIESAIVGRNVLLVSHGFNVNQMDGLQKLSDWAKLIQVEGLVVVGMLWPGDSRWIHVVDYPIEGNEAIGAGKLLAAFLNANFGSAISLSFASHSLGARVVLQTIAGMDRNVRRLLLMAGAIDNTCLSAEYATAAARVQAISVLASRSDDVLRWAFPTGNFFSGLFSRGTPYIHEALGRDGPAAPLPKPNNIDAGWQVPDGWKFGHGSYLPAVAVPCNFPLPVILPFVVTAVDETGPPRPEALQPATMWQPAYTAGFESTRWS